MTMGKRLIGYTKSWNFTALEDLANSGSIGMISGLNLDFVYPINRFPIVISTFFQVEILADLFRKMNVNLVKRYGLMSVVPIVFTHFYISCVSDNFPHVLTLFLAHL